MEYTLKIYEVFDSVRKFIHIDKSDLSALEVKTRTEIISLEKRIEYEVVLRFLADVVVITGAIDSKYIHNQTATHDHFKNVQLCDHKECKVIDDPDLNYHARLILWQAVKLELRTQESFRPDLYDD